MNGSWPHWRPIPIGQPERPPPTTTTSSDVQEEVEISRTLRVGTVILMPSSTNPLYKKRTDRDEKYDKERIRTREDCRIPDYSIGSYERDWR